MTFLQPWAWVGLLAIAAPILAHLLARRPARRVMFPIVRFLPAGVQTPVNRNRITDIWLLAVRCALIVAAVGALSQPVFLSEERQRDLGGEVARAVIHDGRGRTPDRARELAADATVSRVAGERRPSTLIDAAVTWLQTQPVRREVVIVSSFPATSLTTADVARIPASIGVKLEQVADAATSNAAAGRESVTLLAGPADMADARSALAAAIAAGAPTRGRADRPIALLFPDYSRRDALTKDSRELDQPWMFEAVAGIERDAVLQDASRHAGVRVIDRISWKAARVNGVDMLVLTTTEPAHSITTAALIGAAARAAAGWPDATAARPLMTADELRVLERPASPVAVDAAGLSPVDSMGRWLWVVALALMALEWAIARRGRPTEALQEVSDVRRVA